MTPPAEACRVASLPARVRACSSGDRGSTIPLILGFFLLAMVMTAGAIAAGQAFVQQRDLQELCDGAAAAAAASAANLDRTGVPVAGDSLRFGDAQRAVDGYLARENNARDVGTEADLSADDRVIQLRCTRTARIPFGALFGKAGGVRHVVTSSAREPVS
jgi:hypothetical protein